ncbi:MAG TPA: hypothetical protein VN327_07945, partial [Pseudonocardiaceae bacterium]|nr:hypothetical protein [Pseudonocardiaceae bacterium]
PSAIPREISSPSTSVNGLRSQLTQCSSSTVSPTIYTKINCFDQLGSRPRCLWNCWAWYE